MQLSIAPTFSNLASRFQYFADTIIAERESRAAGALEPRVTATYVDDRSLHSRAASASVTGELKRATRPRWPKEFPKVLISTSIAKLKAHPDYAAAKRGGSGEAGYRIVRDLFKPASIAALPRAAIVAPVILRETANRHLNMLPIALAARVTEIGGGVLRSNIVQTNVAGHTELDLAQRSLHRPAFAGTVEHNAKYVLVDDVVTSGATLAELAAFIRRRGGEIVGIVTLAAGYGSTTLAVRSATLSAVRDIHGAFESAFMAAFGYGFGALTEREARNLQGLDAARIAARIDDRLAIEKVSPVLPAIKHLAEPGSIRTPRVQESEERIGLCDGFGGREKVSGRPVSEIPYG